MQYWDILVTERKIRDITDRKIRDKVTSKQRESGENINALFASGKWAI